MLKLFTHIHRKFKIIISSSHWRSAANLPRPYQIFSVFDRINNDNYDLGLKC